MRAVLVLLVVALIGRAAAQCSPQNYTVQWTSSTLTSTGSLIVRTNGLGANIDVRPILNGGARTAIVQIDGGANQDVSFTEVGNTLVLDVTSFDAESPQGSGASARGAGWMAHPVTIAASVALMSCVLRTRTMMVVLLSYFLVLASYTTTTPMSAAAQGASCTARITIWVPGPLRVDLSEASGVHVSCPTGWVLHPQAGCVEWVSTFSQMYASSSNAGGCANVVSTSYTIFSPPGNSLALSDTSAVYPFAVYSAALRTPYGTASNVQLASGGTANVTFWYYNEGSEQYSVVPVDVYTASGLHCRYAYTCVSGACLADVDAGDYLCAEREIVPANSTGQCANGSPCQKGSVRCTAYCNGKTNTATCNEGLCGTAPSLYTECETDGFCLCLPPGIFAGASVVSVSAAAVLVMAIALAWQQ